MLTANLRAKTVAPRLTPADSDPDTVFLWRCTTSYSSSSSNSRQYLQTATLCNDTGCPQAFALSLEGPFVLVAAVPSVMQDPDAFRCVRVAHTLYPGNNGSIRSVWRVRLLWQEER